MLSETVTGLTGLDGQESMRARTRTHARQVFAAKPVTLSQGVRRVRHCWAFGSSRKVQTCHQPVTAGPCASPRAPHTPARARLNARSVNAGGEPHTRRTGLLPVQLACNSSRFADVSASNAAERLARACYPASPKSRRGAASALSFWPGGRGHGGPSSPLAGVRVAATPSPAWGAPAGIRATLAYTGRAAGGWPLGPTVARKARLGALVQVSP